MLPTGANIVTAAGDCAIATSDASGNWRVRDYQRADGTPLAGGGLSADAVTASMIAASSRGYALPMSNGTIVESHASNAVTFAVKTLAGANPSSSDPVDFFFRDATAGAGDYVRRRVTAALSITVASTKTLGTSNATPFRVWLAAVDTGSGVELGVVNCWTGSAVLPLHEDQLISPTATPANSAGVIYTTSGQTSKPFRKIGYATYEPGLTTAGTWNASPTTLQLFGPGIASPGQAISIGKFDNTTQSTTTSASYGSTATTINITPTSAANLVRAFAAGTLRDDQASNGCVAAIFRGSTRVSPEAATFSPSVPTFAAATMLGLDAPGSTSAQTYVVKLKSLNGGTVYFPPTIGGTASSHIEVQEIMG